MGNQRKAKKKRRESRVNIVMFSILIFGFGVLLLLPYWMMRQRLKLVKVEAFSVCMLDDLYTPSKNHPSQIDGFTYYCCYEECGEHFTEKGMSRFAQDSISGATVNKANAIYGRAQNGRIFYFENEENLAAYPP